MNTRRLVALAAISSALARAASPQSPRTAPDGADSLRVRGLALYREGKRESLEEAIRTFQNAAASYERAANGSRVREMLINIATIHNNLGRPDSALVYHRRVAALAANAGDDNSRGSAITQIGQVFHGTGRIDSALVYYREALALARRGGLRPAIGLNLNNIGLAHQALGRLDSALASLAASLAIRREVGDSLGESVTLNNIAQAEQSLGRPDSAIFFLRRSLALRRAIGDRAGQGSALNNIAFSFENLQQNDSALVYYRQAQVLLRDGSRRSVYGITLANLGRVFLALGTLDSARMYIDQGLAVKREVGDRSGESWALNDLGRLHQAAGRKDSALTLFANALAIMREVGDREREGRTLAQIGEIYHRSASTPDLRIAVAYYDSAAAIHAGVASGAGGDANRLTFAEQDVHLHERWVLAWLARAPDIGADAAARAALAAAERGRAQALLDLLRSSRAENTARSATTATGTVPGADMPAEGATVARSVAARSTTAVSYLVTHDTLIAWLITGAGNVAVSRTPVGQDSIASLVSALRAGLGVDDAAIGTRVAMRGSAAFERTSAPPGEVTRTFGRGLRYAAAAGAALAELLMPPALAARIPRSGELVVVPTGPLTLLPFATLPLGRDDVLGAPFGSGLAIRYAPSLTALGESERHPSAMTSVAPAARRAALRSALVVGNPAMPTVMSADGSPITLAPLAAAGDEAAWVAKQFGVGALTGRTASETEVRRRLPNATIVHLATHGFAYSTAQRAGQSFIALAPDMVSDGLLTVGEMLDTGAPSLHAELVVLSACQTGLGDLKQAEGTVGLQRAFLGKGARSVLVSLWSVGDVATEALMKRFYAHWLSDPNAPSKAEALRRAQEDVRKMPGLEHPRFWAAFQLVGAR